LLVWRAGQGGTSLKRLRFCADKPYVMSILEIILAIIALQVVALICLLVAIVVTYARIARTDVKQLRHQWARQLPDALEGGAEAIDCIRGSLGTDVAREAFRTFVDEQLYSDVGDSPSALRELSRTVGFTEWLQHQMLTSRNELDRAAAAKTLGGLHENVDHKVAVELLQSSDPAVVLAASHTIASFGDPNYLLPVFRAVYQRTPITIHGATGLLSEFGRGACPAIHELLRAVVDRYLQADAVESPESPRPLDPEREIDVDDVVAQVVMIDLLAFYTYLPAASTLLALLNLSKAEETIIHVVKALAKVGDAKAVPQLVEMLTHPNWVIRSQAVLALAALDAVEAVPSIRTLLGDESFRVRLYAQRALHSLESFETVSSPETVSSSGVLA
jgi:HEAT repeat protein